MKNLFAAKKPVSQTDADPMNSSPRPPKPALETISNIGSLLDQDELLTLPVEWLKPDPDQDRKDWDSANAQSDLGELAQSIRNEGVRRPLEVQRIAHQKYQIIAGERRWRAACQAGRKEVPCLCRTNIDDRQASIDQLTENIDRRGLNHLEIANGLKRRIENNISRAELQHATGKSPAWISKRLALLELPNDVQEIIQSGLIRDLDTLFALGKLDDSEREAQIAAIKDGHFDGTKLKTGKKRKSPTPPKTKHKPFTLAPDEIAYLLQKLGVAIPNDSPEAIATCLDAYLKSYRDKEKASKPK